MTLHCPATLLVASTPRGDSARGRFLEAVTRERVLTVAAAPGDDEGRTVAEAIGVPLEEEPGLASPTVDDAVLRSIADLHRGEVVLVLAPASGGGDAPVVRVEVG